MEKKVAVVEITSSNVKLVVGYELNGEPYVIYSLVKPMEHFVENGTFADIQSVEDLMKNILDIVDPSVRLRIKITNPIFILPPIGLEIYEANQVTAVIRDDNVIQNLDIRNLYSFIRKGCSLDNSEIIDIIPDEFILENSESYKNPPLGKSSNMLGIHAKVHTLPKNINAGFDKLADDLKINVKRRFVAPFAASQLLAASKDMPTDYILVDIGSHTTTISLIGDQQVYSSRFISWGGQNLTDTISKTFGLSLEEAEKLKITYGIDKRKMSFRVPLCEVEQEDGTMVKHYVDELTQTIKGELDVFISQLNASINNLLASYESNIKGLPMVLIGGGSMLNGFKEYLEPKVQSQEVSIFVPKNFGARYPSLVNCLGAILADAKYQTVFDETNPNIGQLTRSKK